MKDLIREIKFGFQRMFRGYSDDIFWEFDSYFYQFIPAIKEFCQKELDNIGDNPHRKEIMETTIRLAKELENMDSQEQYKNDNATTRFWEYFGRNITIYWD